MLVRELVTRDVAHLRGSSSLDSAIRVLAERHVSALPVVDDENRVVGIISEADVLRLHLSADPRAHLRPVPEPPAPQWPTTVGEVMSADPWVAREGSDVADVARVMADTGWKSVPVVDDDHVLVGMVSRSDVIRVLSTRDADIWLRLVRDFAELHQPAWTPSVSRGVVTVHGVRAGRDAQLVADMARTVPGVREVVVHSEPAGDQGSSTSA